MHDLYPDLYEGCAVDVCYLNSVYTEATIAEDGGYADAAEHGSEPGIEAMRDAVEGITGLSIQYYVLVDMAGFTELIDALGGVDINVTERLPIGGDENLEQVEGWIEPGLQHMDGTTALWYARSRHSTSDYDRMSRQRELQTAILTQFQPANVLSKFQGIAQAGADVVKTDVPQSTLAYFLDLALKTKDLPIDNVELVPPLIDPEDPDWATVRQSVTDALVLSSSKTQ